MAEVNKKNLGKEVQNKPENGNKLKEKGKDKLKEKEKFEKSETEGGVLDKEQKAGPDGNELQEMIELLQRTQANFENYRKQVEKRMEEIREMAAKDVILQMLPVVDNFELALKNSGVHKLDYKLDGEFLNGVKLIYSQLLAVLENNGVQAIETENGVFSPYYHEALIRVDSELPENTIIEEFQKGFTLHNKVIRHAKVKISFGNKGGHEDTMDKNNLVNKNNMANKNNAVKKNNTHLNANNNPNANTNLNVDGGN